MISCAIPDRDGQGGSDGWGRGERYEKDMRVRDPVDICGG